MVITSRNLIIDIAPLWEDQFTGISNVVCEVATRALQANRKRLNFRFSAFEQMIDSSIVKKCVTDRNGLTLRAAVNGGFLKHIDNDTSIDKNRDIGLFMHLKPPFKRYFKEFHLYYDFSFLSVPETHTNGTIEFHLNNLISQIETTDFFFTISNSTALDLQWYFGITNNRIMVTHLGHNADISAANNFMLRTHGRSVEPFMLILGTIEPRKNLSSVLAWLTSNRDAMQSFRFVFCGRDGWGANFAELVSNFKLEDAVLEGRILHLGYITEKEKAALISSAAGLIYPSLFEGFGLPVLEAMALGVPVIASCSTSIPEIMGDDGYYFDPYSVESFTKAFLDFVADRRSGVIYNRLARLKERSRIFSYDKMFENIMGSIEKLLV